MSDEAHVLDLLPAYALGSLDSEEARRVVEHLSGCLICRNESDSFQAVADQLKFCHACRGSLSRFERSAHATREINTFPAALFRSVSCPLLAGPPSSGLEPGKFILHFCFGRIQPVPMAASRPAGICHVAGRNAGGAAHGCRSGFESDRLCPHQHGRR